jgi:hypothetical protein
MAYRAILASTVGLLLVVLGALPAAAAPVNSDLAIAANGGGCHPTGLTPALLDMLTLINPEWAPIVGGGNIDTDPVLVHGVVQGMHGDTSGDFPSTHLRADVNHFVLLDPADADRLATGNDDGLIHTEWEAGVYPAWAWAGPGDRLVALGRWIFDCGHPGAAPGNCSVSTSRQCVLDGDCRPPVCTTGCGASEVCVGTHYGYSAEIHPPQATAAIRQGRGGVVSMRPGAKAVPATRVDVYLSDQGGGAGDRCVLTHVTPDVAQLGTECFPLAQPVARMNFQDFSFDVPLPPRPASAHRADWRIVTYPPPGGTAPRVRVRRRVHDPSPHLEMIVRMTRPTRGVIPTGYAGTMFAGWRGDLSPLTHVRVTINDLVIHNALQPAAPIAPFTCSTANTPCAVDADCPSGETCQGIGVVKAWRMQASVNGEWQEFTGLGSVDTGSVVLQGLVYDQYLPPGGEVHLVADGRALECIDAIYGVSLAHDLTQVGFNKGVACLASTAHFPGQLDVTYAGPDFGAGTGGSTDYETVSSGGEGGHCSMSTMLLCTVDGDCPSGESCVTTGSAFTLRYRIERVP